MAADPAQVRAALQRVLDPCMVAAGHDDLSVVDLGLVRDVTVDGAKVTVTITFTEPGCQFTHRVVDDIYRHVQAVPGVAHVEVVPQWLPLWTQDDLGERARAAFAASRARAAAVLGARPTLPLAR